MYVFNIILAPLYVIIMNLSEMKVEKGKTIIIASIICAMIMFISSIYPKMDYYVAKYHENKETYKILNQAMDMIPDGASVCASGFFVPHLSDHLEMYDQNHLTEVKLTEYLVVDERVAEREKFNDVLDTGEYEMIYHEDNLVSIYHKK